MMINKKYFFIGIGGIGMSSIAQYLHDKGNIVFGYDRENNQVIKILLNKGIVITNELNLDLIPKEMMGDDVEIIYTPAVKDDNIYLEGDSYLENKEYKIYGKNIFIKIKEEISNACP